jgi:hypothetical protein
MKGLSSVVTPGGEEVLALHCESISQNINSEDQPLYSLNIGVVTLLPKLQEAKMIQQYRPICMLYVSFKIFTKVLANSFISVANRIIKPSQTAFLPRRFIMELFAPKFGNFMTNVVYGRKLMIWYQRMDTVGQGRFISKDSTKGKLESIYLNILYLDIFC